VDAVFLAVVGVADQYMILMAITLLFTLLALLFHESKTLSLIAGVSWLVSAVGHFSIGDQTSPLTISLALLFLGFGILFVLKTIFETLKLLESNRTSDRLVG